MQEGVSGTHCGPTFVCLLGRVYKSHCNNVIRTETKITLHRDQSLVQFHWIPWGRSDSFHISIPVCDGLVIDICLDHPRTHTLPAGAHKCRMGTVSAYVPSGGF